MVRFFEALVRAFRISIVSVLLPEPLGQGQYSDNRTCSAYICALRWFYDYTFLCALQPPAVLSLWARRTESSLYAGLTSSTMTSFKTSCSLVCVFLCRFLIPNFLLLISVIQNVLCLFYITYRFVQTALRLPTSMQDSDNTFLVVAFLFAKLSPFSRTLVTRRLWKTCLHLFKLAIFWSL